MLGSQIPRIEYVPDYDQTSGHEAVELAARAGLELDPWQQHVLVQSLGERKKDQKWAAFEVGLVVPRQNGKGVVLQARELAGLFLLGERFIIHSAHLFDTSMEHYNRLLNLIEGVPEFDQRVKSATKSHGAEGITLFGGQQIQFRTRSRGGGRGFSCDLLVFDEAMFLKEMSHGALMPTVSARPNAQIWYAGSPVDQYIHEDGVVLSRVRQRGLEQEGRLAYFEWSIDAETPGKVTPDQLDSMEQQAVANPGLGIHIMPESIENERDSMDDRTFAVERGGVGDWFDPDVKQTVLSLEQWRKLVDAVSEPVEHLVFAFDVAPDRSMGTLAVSGARDDGLAHVEVGEYRRGTGWMVEKAVFLTEKHPKTVFVYDGSGPAASLAPEMEAAGVNVLPVTAKEHAQACGLFFDAVDQSKLRHLGTTELSSAVRGAEKRPLGEAWAWSRKNSSVDISPLVAVTLAHWGHLTQAAVVDPEPMVAFV